MTIRYKRPGFLCREIWLPICTVGSAFPARPRNRNIELTLALLGAAIGAGRSRR